ncbi:uncharacterized protein BDV17DRAFT_244867 [Aspergillus undulatus]|uniref:uncharacterized protein n=1 Tax=Aspergillus undulatus TaxID=1810928 RepID=UPI003CCCFF18
MRLYSLSTNITSITAQHVHLPQTFHTHAMPASDWLEADGDVVCCFLCCCPVLCYVVFIRPSPCGNARRPRIVPPFRIPKEWESDPLKPLPKHRKSLSMPLTGLKSKIPLLNRQQKKSKLFTHLSADMRLLTYEYVLAPPDNRVLHVASTHKRLCSVRCTNADPRNIRGWQHTCWGLPALLDGTVMRRVARIEHTSLDNEMIQRQREQVQLQSHNESIVGRCNNSCTKKRTIDTPPKYSHGEESPR